MALTVNQKIKFKITRQLVVLGMAMGLLYIFFYHGFREPERYIVGAFSGIIIGLLIAFYELVLFKRGAKKVRFLWLFLLRLIIYLLSVILIIGIASAIARTVRWDMSLIDVFRNPAYYNDYLLGVDFSVAVTYSMFLAFSVNFVRMISRKMGQGVLVSYLSGTYYSPVHQARVVMFLRLKDADRILTKLGPERYFSFLNDVFYDYAIPIVTHRGIIYEYIEDLAVITWSVDKGLERGNAMKTYFDIRETLTAKKEIYLERYGVVPDVRAALHIGSVVRSEIGEIRAQIVLHGDTMNTTARMLNYCLDEDQEIVTSKPLLHMIELPEGIKKEEIGPIGLKGKEEKMNLYRLFQSGDESNKPEEA